jgi:hypothetical protein
MKTQSPLTQVLPLSMPVGIVFSHSFLGGDAFLVALQRDCRRHRLRWEESFSQPGLCEIPLSSADRRQVERLRQQERLVAIPLGEDGLVYELTDRPFRSYAEPILRAIRGVSTAEESG